jgi:hypothetical protein
MLMPILADGISKPLPVKRIRIVAQIIQKNPARAGVNNLGTSGFFLIVMVYIAKPRATKNP